LCIFSCCLVLQYQSIDWLSGTPPKLPITRAGCDVVNLCPLILMSNPLHAICDAVALLQMPCLVSPQSCIRYELSSFKPFQETELTAVRKSDSKNVQISIRLQAEVTHASPTWYQVSNAVFRRSVDYTMKSYYVALSCRSPLTAC